MDKFKITQIIKLLAIAAFLIITPLLSTSLRPTYLYFVLNLLIIALGAEAGLLSFIFKAAEEKKGAALGGSTGQNSKLAATNLAVTVTEKSQMASEAAETNEKLEEVGNTVNETAAASDHAKPKASKVVQKSSSQKINVGSLKHRAVKKCPSTPSLFFLGGGEIDHQPEELVEDGGDDDQELFHRAETFIGNFYTQLKMQREDSWKKLHEIYQKAF